MSDRQLLEAAARAAGYIIVGDEHPDDALNVMFEDGGLIWVWMPLTDDGDALRLAVKRKVLRCHMDLFHRFYEEEIAAGLDEGAATRRAIVRAAEIGKGMA